MRRFGTVCAALVIASVFAPDRLDAGEPYLALRTGLSCAQCHMNRSGGGMRNDFGSIYAQTRLAMTSGGATGGTFVSPWISEFLALGADLRVRSSRQLAGTEPKNEIEIREGNVYLAARLFSERLLLYVDESVAPGSARSREAFLLVERLPGDAYVKVGRFFVPYGLRLLDDSEFTRQRTGFNYANSDHGIEVGAEPGPLSFAVALTNGTQGGAENNSAKQISGLASVVNRRFRLGVSGARNEGPDATREVAGIFGGLSAGRLALFGEADLIFDDPPEGRSGDAFAAFLEGDLLVRQGLNAKVTYGYLDPDRDIGENARTRVRFGLETFLMPFLQASVFYIWNEDIPQATRDRDELAVELHAFF